MAIPGFNRLRQIGRSAKAGAVRLTDTDRGWKAIVRSLEDAKGSSVRVGVLGRKALDGGGGARPTNAELAVIHEFGAPGANIPARSFIRAPFDAHHAEYLALMRVLIGRIYAKRMTVEQVLGLVGARVSADFKKHIVAGIDPPNSQRTLRRKLRLGRGGAGAPKPLIDTGRLLQSITWEVLMNGAPKGGPR